MNYVCFHRFPGAPFWKRENEFVFLKLNMQGYSKMCCEIFKFLAMFLMLKRISLYHVVVSERNDWKCRIKI